jgi:phytoene dehydrogenase-like protein
MAHEVVVVGGGIGGLTVAALLAARGVDVCLLERQPEVGGCVASVEKFGYTFEPTLGLYPGWEKEGTFERIFSELPVDPPETRAVSSGFVAHLVDGARIAISANDQEFRASLLSAFPECAEKAVDFYRDLAAARGKKSGRILNLFQRGSQVAKLKDQTLEHRLSEMPERFRMFIELQLLLFAERPLDQWSLSDASVALVQVRKPLFTIRGGAAALAESLAASIRKSGGSVRLASPVLRLSYDAQGNATGVDLLTGENVPATRAIISNMTVWDTYGKLIGLQRTPADLRKHLNASKSSGVYLIYAGMEEEVARQLPGHLLVSGNQSSDAESLIDMTGFAFSVAPEWDTRAPESKRAVTIVFRTDVDGWFTYQADHTVHEEQDQSALEIGWNLIHERLPGLGSGLEVIETATPQTYYDLTRRKLGMVGSPNPRLTLPYDDSLHGTNFPNVFRIGDTISSVHSVADVSQSALTLAEDLVSRF